MLQPTNLASKCIYFHPRCDYPYEPDYLYLLIKISSALFLSLFSTISFIVNLSRFH